MSAEIWVVECNEGTNLWHYDASFEDKPEADRYLEYCERTWQQVDFRIVRYVPEPPERGAK